MNTQIKKGGTISYGYDKGGNINSVSAGGGSEVSHNRIERKLGRVTKVVSDSAEYEYRYDRFGKIAELRSGGNTYSSISRYNNPTTGEEVVTKNYSNFSSITNIGNRKGNIVSVRYTDTAAALPEKTILENIYDSHDNLVSQKDYSQSDRTITHNTKLDKYGRETERSVAENDNEVLSIKNTINDLGQVINQRTIVSGSVRQVSFGYGEDVDRRLNMLEFGDMLQQEISYDKLGRISSITNNNNYRRNEYYYRQIGDHTSNMIASEWLVTPQGTERIKYSYDTLGNIVEVNENGKPIVFYTYDALNRLVREDNKKWGKSTTYDYDPSGNIVGKVEYAFSRAKTEELTPIKEHSYGYTQSGNRDQLTNFNGQTSWYDIIGNPIMYREKQLTWDRVRLLKQYGDNVSFTYNAAGVRLSKTVKTPPTESMPVETNRTTRYFYDGMTLIGERTENKALQYIYGINGLYGLTDNYGVTYTYKKNAQGDILAIVDSYGFEVVRYVYDAYGNHKIFIYDYDKYIDISDQVWYNGDNQNGASGGVDIDNHPNARLALANPFRYRGYYYDQETGLYYLMSRYYDPETGRFINADDISYLDPETVGGLNLYAYCGGNPVMNIDPDGHAFFSILIAMGIGFLIGGAIGGGFEVGKQIYQNGWNPGDWNWQQIGLSALGGAVAGMISAIPIGGWVGALAFGGIGSVAGGLITGSVNSWDTALLAFGLGAIANVAAFGISNKFANIKAGKIFNQGNKAKSLAVQQFQGNKFNMGAQALKGSFRNAFKQTTQKEIQKLLLNASPWLRYGIYSAMFSSTLSGWY